MKTRMEMRTKVFFTGIASLLLLLGVWGCSNEDPTADIPDEDCITENITGKIIEYEIKKEDVDKYDPEFIKDLDKYVFIGVVSMSEEDEAYSYIKTVVVPQNKFPVRRYKGGDVITFRLVEVKSTYPESYIGYNPCTAYICSIKLCK